MSEKKSPDRHIILHKYLNSVYHVYIQYNIYLFIAERMVYYEDVITLLIFSM